MNKTLSRIAQSALLYAATLISFQYIFNLPNTNIRIASFIAPVIGIIWGPVGAIGIGLGNFLGDMYDPNFQWNYGIIEYILGSLGNSLVAILSYIMWHSLFLRSSDDPFSINLRNIIRYIVIQFIVAIVTSLYFTLINILSPWHSSAWNLFCIILINNFDVNVILGLPALLMLISNNRQFYCPTQNEFNPHRSRLIDIFLAVLSIISVVIISLPVDTFNSIVLWRRIFVLGFFVYLLRPIPQTQRHQNLLPKSIYYQITKGFCILMFYLTIILSIYSFLSMSGDYSSIEIWMIFYKNVFIVLHCMLAVLLFLLWYLESRIIKPILDITNTAALFTRSDPEDPAQRIDSNIIRSGDEIELLSKTFNEMLHSIYDYIDNLKRTLSERDVYKAKSETDKLTKLFNKAGMERVIKEKLECLASDKIAALYIIDLDHFKEANDTYGHQCGDIILQKFAESISKMFRKTDCIGRFGGDEFVILMTDFSDEEIINQKAEQILTAARNIQVEGAEVRITASIGISLAPKHGKTYESLFKYADRAVYVVKEQGRNNYHVSGRQ